MFATSRFAVPTSHGGGAPFDQASSRSSVPGSTLVFAYPRAGASRQMRDVGGARLTAWPCARSDVREWLCACASVDFGASNRMESATASRRSSRRSTNLSFLAGLAVRCQPRLYRLSVVEVLWIYRVSVCLSRSLLSGRGRGGVVLLSTLLQLVYAIPSRKAEATGKTGSADVCPPRRTRPRDDSISVGS